MTKQLATAALEKFVNVEFFGPWGCKAEWRGTSNLHIIVALRQLINVWLFGTAHLGFEGSASILDR